MADTVIAAQLTLEADQANTTVKGFKQQLKEANNELLNMSQRFGETSDQAVAAAKRVAELRDTMGDAKSLVDAFNPDRKFEAFGNVVRGVAGGFSALQGTMALVGAEGEEVQETLLKVQSALAISDGVNNILELKDTFKQLGTFIQSTTLYQKANNAATQAAAFVQKLFGVEVQTTSTKFQILKGAIVATGIGLLVVAIGEVVSIMQSWTSATEDQIEAQKELAESTKKLADAGLKAEMDFISQKEKLDIAKAQAAGKTEEEIYNIQQGWQDTRINSQKRHLAEVATVDEIAAQESKRQLRALENEKEITRLKFEEKQRKDAEEAAKKATQEAKARAEKEKQARQEFIAAEKAASDEIIRLQQQNALAAIKDEDERNKLRIQFEFENAKVRIEALKVSEGLKTELLKQETTARDLALEEVEKSIDEKRAARDAARLEASRNQVVASVAKTGEELQAQLDLQTELDNQNKSRLQLQLEELDAWYKEKQRIAGDNEALQTQLTLDYEKKKTALVREENRQRLDIAANLLGQASGLFAKHTAAYKAIAVAQATIQTFQSAQGAFSGMVSQIPGPVGIALGVAAAAFAVASGIKNIANIVKQKVPGAEGGGGSSVPAVSASAPAPLAPTPQVATTQIDAASINQIGNATSRAYVVESDVTDSQERITRLNRAARLGG